MSGAPLPRGEHSIQLSSAVNVSSKSVVTNTAPLPAVHAVSSSDGVRHSKNAGRKHLHPACVGATASIVMRVSSTRLVRTVGACGGRNGWHRVGASSTHAVEAHSYLRDGERLLSREYHTVVMERKCRRSGMHLATVGSLAQTDLKQAGLRGFRPQLHCVFEHSTDRPVVLPVRCAGNEDKGEWNTWIDVHVWCKI